MTMARYLGSWLFSATLALSLAASSALATEPQTPARVVTVTAPRCGAGGEGMELVMRALDVELAHGALQPRAADDAALDAAARVSLHLPECSLGATTVRFDVQTDAAPFGVRRSVALDDVPASARARTLAITIAESVREALDRPKALPARPPEAAAAIADARPETTDTEQVSASADRGVATRVGAAAHGRFAFEASAPFIGLELNLRTPLSGPIALAFEGSYAASSDTKRIDGFRFGFDIDHMSLAIGADFVVGERPSLSVGPRLALARLDITSRSLFGIGSTVGLTSASLIGGAGLRGAASLPLGDVVSLDASLDVQHLWGELPTARASAGVEGSAVVLPGYQYEVAAPPPPERVGLFPWMFTLGVGAGFRM